MDILETIEYLDEWLKSRSDGEWEHQNGITIDTTDNPGWMIRVSSQGEIPKNDLEVSSDLSDGEIEGLITTDGMVLFSTDLLPLLIKAAQLLRDREQ